MKFDKPIPVTTIARLIGADVVGNSNGNATGITAFNQKPALSSLIKKQIFLMAKHYYWLMSLLKPI